MTIQTTNQSTVARHRWTVDEYYRLGEYGILGPESRTELIDGDVVDMPPIGPGHSGHVIRYTRIFGRRLGDAALLSDQNPLRLGSGSEPQPDFVLLKPRADDYTRSHPTPADVLLVIEVSESTLAFDREAKGLMYAQAGILDFWITNLVDRQIEVHRDPTPGGYKSIQVLKPGDVIRPLAFLDLDVAVSDILG